MGKIPVQDLARMMGIANQDLIFKLKSIGVRVEGEDAHIDTDIIQAILQGKKLPHPREVILRDEQAKSSPAAQPRRIRRPPVNPLRPGRPRTMIQKVEQRIKTIPASERPEKAPPPEKKERETVEAAEATAPRTAPPETPARPPEAAKEPPAGAPEKAPEAAAKTKEKEKVKVKEKEAKGKEKEKEKEKKARRGRRDVEEEDLTAYRGRVGEIGEEEEPAKAKVASTADRRKRRTERKKEERAAGGQGKVLPFKQAPPSGPITIAEGMTVREFAEKLNVKVKDLIKALLSHGVIANINHVLEPELAQRLAEELGVEAMVVSFEEEVQLKQEMEQIESGMDVAEARQGRAPVVTIMGHVDHGKTSLLDTIRKSKVTESEFGGITQHIGAYDVEVDGRKIVFVDTPGHEAFTMMRARGAGVTDIVVLVVAADDGVMPQTIEAIDHARAAKVPLVVAINKIDKANANPDRVKKELADHKLMVEEWGGDTVAVPISALKGEGIHELLEMILLTADLLELKANPEIPAQGTVLEARKEAGRGIVATVLVQNGTLSVGDSFVSGRTWGRVRSMNDDLGQRVEEVAPSTPVEVTGFDDLPEAGDLLQVLEDESRARGIAEFRSQERRRQDLSQTRGKISLDQLFDRMEKGEVKELPVVLKADVQGSVEVLKENLRKLSTEKVKVQVIHSGVGSISANDVLLASASDAVIIGFNVRPERNAADLADKEEVDIRLHTVIYELTDELRKAMAGLLEPTFREVVRGRAEVRDTFKVPKVGTVAGCHVVEGTLRRNDSVRLLRDNVVVHEGKIGSLRRFKDDATEVRSGFDCGIGLERYQDVKPGDIIEAYHREEVAPSL